MLVDFAIVLNSKATLPVERITLRQVERFYHREHVYEVKGMDDKTFLCHVQRMKFYDSISSVVEQEKVLWQFIHTRASSRWRH